MLLLSAEMTSANSKIGMFTGLPHACVWVCVDNMLSARSVCTCVRVCVLYVCANAAWYIFVLGLGQILESTCPSFIDE